MECVKCKDEEGSSLERRLEAHPVCVWCVCVWCVCGGGVGSEGS